ncbi:MAG TPA: translation initiation factor IF-2 [Gemmatimonadales bacterium]|nr:translation initiation factor IF-2 [Gemmatimonadales bacterium]
MGTTRIHDLAAEFGISAEQLMGMLKEMDVFVRSHLSPLKDEQVALVRARWERDKRKSKEPATPTKRRRAVKVAPEPAPEPVAARPTRRRRTAAEVAAAEAEASAAAEVEAMAEQRARDALEAAAKAQIEEKPVVSLEERAAQLFKDLPRAADPLQPAATSAVVEPPLAPPAPSAPTAPPPARPFIPTPVRPKPVASHTPGTPMPPRPVASGMPNFGGPGAGSPGGGGGPGLDDRRRDKGGKKRKKGKKSVDQEAVAQNISRTLSALKGPVGRKGPHRREEGPSYRDIQEQQRQEQKEREKTLVRVTEFITVSELASTLKVPPTQIVTFAFKELGQMVTINQRLDFDMIELIASAFGFQAVQEEEYVSSGAPEEAADAAETLKPRPPIVTVMGHVDHGKTSLLDYIRQANVVAGEAGGITQHIGAYHVTLKDGRTITFLDTPGHEAFTAMRARGAQVTDIVVLVVAADDAIMPQTIEAISHAKNAGVPLVVAINKIDLPSANVQKVKQDLLAHGVVLEEFGGTTLMTPISAKKGTGVDKLLDQILLQAELLDLKANPDRRAAGAVLEATLDPGKGPVATILVQNGTLRVGDDFICGQFSGRVRAVTDERGQTVKEAGPSIPVQILGFEGVPEAGDTFTVMEDAGAAREIAQKRQRLEREAQHRRTGRVKTLEDFMAERVDGGAASLKIIIKADQGGPAEALADALAQLSTSEVKVEVVHRGVGAITDSDVLLAKASNAIIIGFHVRPDSNARASAERERVEIRTYRIIYEAVDEVKSAMEGLLAPEKKEVVLGEAEVRQVFKIAKVGTIAGSFVRSGVIPRTAKVRVVRNGVEVYDGTLASLKRFKDDAREVREGFECGIGVENFNDVKVGDLIEAYRIDEVARTLSGGTAAKAN